MFPASWFPNMLVTGFQKESFPSGIVYLYMYINFNVCYETVKRTTHYNIP